MCNYSTERSIFLLSSPRPEVPMSALPASAPSPPWTSPTAPVFQIRPLRPHDEDLLVEVFDGLSARSRYTRFHSPKPRLTARDRAFLCGVDGRDHLALVALGSDGSAHGIARAVRLRDDRAAADIAVEVIDASQNKGLGFTLLARLARQAAGAGIERFTATVLTQTGLHRSLLRRGWRVTIDDGTSITLEADVWVVMGRVIETDARPVGAGRRVAAPSSPASRAELS
jgi:hypothetical protein